MMNKPTIQKKRGKRVARIRAVVKGDAKRPRIAFLRTHYYLYAQCIDDTTGKTITAVKTKGTNVTSAKELSALLVKTLKAKKISAIVFDRGGNKYHGVVKACADAIREGGIVV